MTDDRMPGSLARFFRWDGDALVARGGNAVTLGWLAFGLAGFFAVVAWLAMVYSSGLCAMLGGAMVPALMVWGAMLLLDREDVPLRLDADGLTLRGQGVVRYSQVSLSGEPGQSVRLAVLGPSGWIELHRGFPTPPWDLEGLIWYAHRLAGIGQVELTGDFDVALWRRWREEPALRPKLKLERLVRESRATYGPLLDGPSIEPEDAELGMDGLVWGSVVLNRDELKGERHALLDVVEEVEVVIVGEQAVLYVRTASELRAILSRPHTERNVGELQWLAGKVRKAAEAAQAHDEGHHGDVPDALKRMATREKA